MKKTLLAGTAAILLSFGSSAMAQTATITVAPEQRTTIKEYVKTERVPAVKVKEEVRVGVRLPAEVELRPVPEKWGPQLSRYRYVYVGNRVALVQPDTREVVYIVD
jgi:hypothetical protein